MTYDLRRVWNDGEGCQHGTEVYKHEPYRHYCLECGADLDEIADLTGLQSDLDELESTDQIVKAAAKSYDRMVSSLITAKAVRDEFLEYQAQHLNPAQVESLRHWVEKGPSPDTCEHEIITMCALCGMDVREL